MIDKKGRVFGKINIIDLTIVLLVVCVLGAIGYKLFFQKESDVKQPATVETGTVYATFEINSIPAESLKSIQEGDRLIVSDNVSDIEIVSVTSDAAKYVDVTADGELIVADNPLYLDCTIQVKASAIRDGLGIAINGEYFRVNQSREIITNKFYGVSRLVDIRFEVAE